MNAPVQKPRFKESGAEYTRSLAEYECLKEGAVLVDLSYKSILELAGRDPVGMLNAILTNEVPEEGSIGAYAALLNPKGRIQTDLRVLKRGDYVLIDTEPEGVQAAREILSRYAPFSRVEVSGSSWDILGLYGPHTSELLGVPALKEHETTEVEVGGATLLAAGVAVPVPGIDLVGPANALQSASQALIPAGAKPVGLDVYEAARVESGIPRFGADITPENFPAEAGILERAVSFRKGCYPGQETVARMYYRGHPNKTLHRLASKGPPPSPGTPILQNEKQVGTITSASPLPVNGYYLALGYLSRNADPQAPLCAGDATISIRDNT